jgi:hypothetical protein
MEGCDRFRDAKGTDIRDLGLCHRVRDLVPILARIDTIASKNEWHIHKEGNVSAVMKSGRARISAILFQVVNNRMSLFVHKDPPSLSVSLTTIFLFPMLSII